MSTTTATAQQSAPTGVTFEYRTVKVHRDLEPIARDTYRGFGWSIEENSTALPNPTHITLRLKRDRHIPRREQVEQLQRRAEKALLEVERLERSKGVKATTASAAAGVIGAGFLAGSVFAVTGGAIVLMIVLGTVGLTSWGAGYLLNRRVRRSTTAKVTPLIDQQYELIYSASEEAAALLS